MEDLASNRAGLASFEPLHESANAQDGVKDRNEERMGTFESFKRQAVTLERQLEDKVTKYQQLTQKYADPLSRAELGDTEPKNCAAAVQNLQQQLQDVIHKLSSAAVTPSQRAATKRYQDILADLKSDYDKAVAAYQRAAARHELLGDAAPNSAGNEKNEAMDSLLRERNHINNSLNAAAGVIGQAEAVRSDLHWQGRSLRNTGGLMGQIAANVPGINTLIDNIRRKRLQDDKIVAATVAFCIVFTLWYIFG